ncbi:MAG: YvcK family protein, partial [Acidobacteria bacterium]|nr:YvcK family protein [Acidobacteriota bacterium]
MPISTNCSNTDPFASLSTKDPLNGPLRIVAIGGGTGLSTILHGLKRHAAPQSPKIEVTAIVTVTDDGGSSGRMELSPNLRHESRHTKIPKGEFESCPCHEESSTA